ncbi:MAG: hypothetical protein K0S09_55 [Sphingobacteriaceae bacterium]|jgi:hypothetical protein|nr:hypothetical protein [Sphingobacteriaceae bacterium]
MKPHHDMDSKPYKHRDTRAREAEQINWLLIHIGVGLTALFTFIHYAL